MELTPASTPYHVASKVHKSDVAAFTHVHQPKINLGGNRF